MLNEDASAKLLVLSLSVAWSVFNQALVGALGGLAPGCERHHRNGACQL
jgi:hypothetical protein